MKMAEAFPKSRFVGYDFSDEAISFANATAQRTGLSNAKFAVEDVSALGNSESFDLITAFDAIHDQAQPLVVLKNICGALRKDGTFIMQDIDASSAVEQNRQHRSVHFSTQCLACTA